MLPIHIKIYDRDHARRYWRRPLSFNKLWESFLQCLVTDENDTYDETLVNSCTLIHKIDGIYLEFENMEDLEIFSTYVLLRAPQ